MNKGSIKTGIIGASGYSGAELLRLMAGHCALELVFATADSQADQDITTLYPHLRRYAGHKFIKFERLGERLNEAELIFCALPHGEAMKILPQLKNRVIIDLGGDFRLDNAAEYSKWYKREHTASAALKDWEYGLTELFREAIRSARFIANPGCYPTAAILPLAPLLKNSLISGVLTINALSGSSGAGRSLSPALHAPHLLEDARAYKVTEHQHTPEIEMALKRYSGKSSLVSFTPHLVPMVRGIHATCSAEAAPGVTLNNLFECLIETYKNEPFIQVSKAGSGCKEVRGSNQAVITPYLDQRAGRVIITAVIDNLVKGAAGQAIQNANLIFGLEEAEGLQAQPLYP